MATNGDHPATPTEHFRLYFYATVSQVIERVLPAFESPEAAFARFPFLVAYHQELNDEIRQGLATRGSEAWWRAAIAEWEASGRSTASLDEVVARLGRAIV